MMKDPKGEKTPRRLRQTIIGAGLGLLAGLAIASVMLLGTLRRYESRLADLFYHPQSPINQLVLVVIDDKTVEDYGWPLERFVLSGFVSAVSLAQPRVIALDFILPDPVSQEDVFVATALNRAGKLVQPMLGVEATRYPSSVSQFPAFDSVLLPAPSLRTSNSTLAHAMIYPDSDGIVRRIPLAIDSPGQRYPAFGLAVLALSVGADPNEMVRTDPIMLAGRPIPVDNQGQGLINFVNPQELHRVSFSDFVRGKVDLDIFRDKIVVVGPGTLNAVHESYAVPPSVGNSPAFNIEIQASLIDTISRGEFLREEDRPVQIALVIAVALFAGVTLVHFSRFYSAALALLYLAVYLLYGFHQFDNGIILTPLYPALALALSFSFAMPYRYFSRERTRAQIARMFLGSVAPESVNEVLALYDRGALSLTAGRREVSVLSITLRGLAPLSETSAPEAVMEAMSLYSARIFESVFQSGGSIHSQVANTTITMWNLPLLQPDHVQRAVRVAFEIQQQIKKLSEENPARAMVKSGLGVATGPVVAGQLSSTSRTGYSVIGDVVNLAERFSILATENQVYVDTATREQIRDQFESGVVHQLRLRGKKEPVQVWELRPRLNVKQIQLS